MPDKPKLQGMRELTADQIEYMNRLSDMGNKLAILVTSIKDEASFDIDERWLNIGKTHLQEGLMCVKRSIGQPDNF